jgi:hypothetical protein
MVGRVQEGQCGVQAGLIEGEAIMKRVAAALALAAALVVAAAATAGAAVELSDSVSGSGFLSRDCLPVRDAEARGPNNGFEIDHFNNDGSFAWAWGGGHNVTHVTNVSNGNTVALNTTGPGKFTFNADDSVTIDGTGHWLVGYFPGDSPSFSLVYYSGHIVPRQSMTGQLTLVSYVGAPPQDVCAMIA